MSSNDRELGLHVPITRRDFVDGVAVAIGGIVGTRVPSLSDWLAQAPPYPPALTGLRGSHIGSFEVFHRLRDGSFWQTAGEPHPTGEVYDLIVIGAGLSGLAAAHHYRKVRPNASILILDNHDDFGGHAKRNELNAGGAFRIGYGGTQSIDSPAPYSKESKALVTELGVDVGRYRSVVDSRLYANLKSGFFFDRETFGTDQLVRGGRRELDAQFIAAAPISAAAKASLTRLTTERFDPYPGESSRQKKSRLARISYRAFLLDVWKLDPGVIPIFQTAAHDLFGVGIDAVPAQDAFALGLPGFQGLALDPGPGPGQNYDTIRSPEAERYYFHFPDGNASLARLLIRRLIPGAVPGSTADDVVTARVDYRALDRPNGSGGVRVRLSSPVLRVRHRGDPMSATELEVTYQNGTKLASVTGRAVIMACWHTAIPYLCPDLPVAQRTALSFAVKVPLVYTNVMIREWTAFTKLGVSRITCPGFWHTGINLDFPVSIGGYRFPTKPTEPMVLHLFKAACKPGLAARDQHRAGRQELFTTSFEWIERSIRDQLNRVLGAGGFDAARDVLGITVNRWPHGYAYQYNSLFDPFWIDGGEQPCAVARRPFGRIAIANSDSGAYAYTDSAFDHGIRAAREVLSLR